MIPLGDIFTLEFVLTMAALYVLIIGVIAKAIAVGMSERDDEDQDHDQRQESP